MIDRRSVLRALLGSAMAAYAAPRAAGAQPAKTVPRIGLLTADPISARPQTFEAFRQGLRDHGYIEGRSIALDVRSAEGNHDRLPALANELVARPRQS